MTYGIPYIVARTCLNYVPHVSPSSSRSRRGHIQPPRAPPWWVWQSKTLTAGALGRGSRRRSHGELDGFHHHQARRCLQLRRHACTANNAGSFQYYLTMTSDPETGFMTLPEVVADQLIEKFDEFSLSNNGTNFEFGSVSNSTSMSTWVEPRKLALEPSCDLVLPRYKCLLLVTGICNARSVMGMMPITSVHLCPL
jgi:hypothetical protein